MDKKSLKRIVTVFLVAGLSVCQMMTIFAADVSPGYYVFSMVLRACGVSPGEKVGAWQNAYEGYLEKTGNQALLNQVKGYGSLSWGSTAQGVDDLYWSVREWLSSATVKESGDDSCLYELPSFPGPHLDKFVAGESERTINTVPFDAVGPLSGADSGNYVYSFSDGFPSVYWYDNNPSVTYPMYVQRNVYIPKGIEIFGVIVSYTDYKYTVRVDYFTPDKTSPMGYRSVDVKDMRLSFYPDGKIFSSGTEGPYTWNWNNSDPRSVMNYPFKIFATAKDAENYCKTGTVSNLFTTDSITLSSGGTNHGADPELINRKVDSVSSSMKLPVNAAAAGTTLSSIQKSMDLDSLSESLSSAGIDIAYTASYKVEHYKQDISNLDNPDAWVKASEESLIGVVGKSPSWKPRTFPYFIHVPELTEPRNSNIPADGSLVIRLYYKADPDARFPYTVSYHKDGEIFKTFSGTVPIFGDRMVSACEDFCPQYYLPDTKASTPLPYKVSEYKNEIHIYYKRDLYATFPYTVEYYKDGELFKTVPGSISVFDPSVKSCLSYCPSGYVLDTSSSTSLPYSVSKDGGLIKNYYVKKDTVVPYTVEYYKDGLRTNVISGNVPSSSPILQSYPSQCPEYYKLDAERSTPMPFTVPEGGGACPGLL